MLWAAALRCKVQGGQGRYWWSCAAFLSFLCSLIEMESSQQQESAGLEQLTSHPPASPVLNFHEANFIAFPNQRQSNIYGLCSLRINGCNKLLVATLRGQIFSLVGKSVGRVLGKKIVQNLNPLEVLIEYLSYRKTAEEQQTERERIAARRDIAVGLIESEREIILKYFAQRFAERKDALNGFFDVLHTAVQEKNEHAMDTALSGILGIVKDSPLKDFETFRQARADNRVIEI